MATAFLGLGSNLGNRMAFLRGGRDSLASHPGIEVVQAAGVYETTAIGGPPGNPSFLNSVLQIETTLTPLQLLDVCLATEDDFGRTRPERWAPRTLDIDILLYADEVVEDTILTVPHPKLHERAFVLAPLRDIAPDVQPPGLHHPINKLADECAGMDSLVLLRSEW